MDRPIPCRSVMHGAVVSQNGSCVTACQSVPWVLRSRTMAVPYETEARAALAWWSDFPVEADPRPIVMVGPVAWPEDGFVDGAAKLAFLRGAIHGLPGVPDEPIRLLRTRPGRSHQAVVSWLLVVHAERSEAEFWTDRGRRLLSAWRIESPGARGTIWAMDEAALARCWFPPPSDPTRPTGPHTHMRATLAKDEVTLCLQFIGGAESTTAYDGSVLETSAAVCVIPIKRRLESLSPASAGRGVGHRRKLTVRLSGPLGARVLVGLDGSPLEVLSETVP